MSKDEYISRLNDIATDFGKDLSEIGGNFVDKFQHMGLLVIGGVTMKKTVINNDGIKAVSINLDKMTTQKKRCGKKIQTKNQHPRSTTR